MALTIASILFMAACCILLASTGACCILRFIYTTNIPVYTTQTNIILLIIERQIFICMAIRLFTAFCVALPNKAKNILLEIFLVLQTLPIFAIPITTKTKKMHTVILTTAANNNQTVKINRTTVIFTPDFTAKIGKMRANKPLTVDQVPTIGKYTIVALGSNQYAMYYTKNSMGALAAILTIKGGKIVAIEAK